MGRYKANLIDKFETMNKTLKWGIICLSIVSFVAIIIIGVIPQFNKQYIPAHTASIIPDSDPAPTVGQESYQAPKPKQTPKKTIKRTPKKRPLKTNIKYLSSWNSYVISGVAIAQGTQPVVYLEKNGKKMSYRVGESVNNYTITEIHRTYILLKGGNKKIHLNYIK